MLICLHGGAEFGPDCRDMDKALLRRAGTGTVLVLPATVAAGEAYETVGANAAGWYGGLTAEPVVLAPDPRADPVGAAAAVSAAAVVVVPGGRTSLGLHVLRESGVAEALRAAVAAGTAVVGASAGAMLLCEWTVLTDEGDAIVPGLGLVPGTAVLPHYESGMRPAWLGTIAERVPEAYVLGLPECSGVLVGEREVLAVGAGRTRLIRGGAPVQVLDPGTTTQAWW